MLGSRTSTSDTEAACPFGFRLQPIVTIFRQRRRPFLRNTVGPTGFDL
jgi:hypothetical protein